MRHWILLLDKNSTGEAIELLPHEFSPGTQRVITEGPAGSKSFDIRLFPQQRSEARESLRDSASIGGGLAYSMLWDERMLFNSNGLPYQMTCHYDLERLPGHVIGRSADLLFFLAVMGAALPKPEGDYPNFAATGKVGPTGLVEAVVGVPAKVRAAIEVLKATGGVFLYPQANHKELNDDLIQELYSYKIKPCPVKTVEEAIEQLGIPITVYTGKPYLGLHSFKREHLAVYFGRDLEIDELIKKLLDNQKNKQGAITILAPSGAGKSSLIQAGLLPRLERYLLTKNDNQIPPLLSPVLIHTPKSFLSSDASTDITDDELFNALCTRWLPDDFQKQFNTENHQFDEILPVEQNFELLGAAIARTLPNQFTTLWVIDQLEELFTLGFSPEAQQGFAAFLLSLIKQGIMVIAALRNDFFSAYHDTFPRGLTETSDYKLPKLESEALDKIITGPAERAKRPPLLFEVRNGVSLASKIRTDMAGHTDALPLLEFALSLVYEAPETKTHAEMTEVMTYKAYESIGGLYGAIGNYADKIYEGLTIEQQTIFPKVIRGLTYLQNYNVLAFSSQPANYLSFNEIEKILIDHFVAARLFVTSLQNNKEKNLFVIHEALLNHWPKATDILIESIKYLQLRDQFKLDANKWKKNANSKDLLLNQGLPIEEAKQLLKNYSEEIDEDVVFYLRKSIHSFEEAKKKKRNFLSAIFLVFSIMTFYALFESKIAKNNEALAQKKKNHALISQSLMLANLSKQKLAEHKGTEATLLALEALPDNMFTPNRPYVVEAEIALYKAVKQLHEIKSWPKTLEFESCFNNEPMGRIISYSPDGQYFGMIGKVLEKENNSYVLSLKNLTSQKEQQTILGEKCSQLAFSHNGLIATFNDTQLNIFNRENIKKTLYSALFEDIKDIKFFENSKSLIVLETNKWHCLDIKTG